MTYWKTVVGWRENKTQNMFTSMILQNKNSQVFQTTEGFDKQFVSAFSSQKQTLFQNTVKNDLEDKDGIASKCIPQI